MESEKTNISSPNITLTRTERNGVLYPVIKKSSYGMSLYINYNDSCAKEIYNSVKDIVEKLILDNPEYDVIGPMNDNGTGMYLKVTANPFKEWSGINSPLKLSL